MELPNNQVYLTRCLSKSTGYQRSPNPQAYQIISAIFTNFLTIRVMVTHQVFTALLNPHLTTILAQDISHQMSNPS